MTNPAIWTEAECGMLAEMWRIGFQAKEIAAKMGKSDKAVHHKSRRLGLERRVQAKKPTVKVNAPPKLKIVPVAFTDIPCKPVTLSKRKGCCCPVGDSKPQLYCNNPVSTPVKNGTWQYCDAHKSVMFDTARSYHPKAVRRAGKVNGSGWV